MAKKNNKPLAPTQMLVQTVLPGQRSSPGGNVLNFLYRIIPAWGNPAWTEALVWRNFVLSVPVASLCRQTALANLLALDWKIVARDSNQQDELKKDIIHYTKLFENTGEYDGLDWAGRIEWMGKDLLDLPFGMAAEIGRDNDDPAGAVQWIRCLDGGTCMPSLNADFPVIQRVPNIPLEPIAFPRHAITRQYWSPRPEIWREGWGMAPPELIYLVFELLKRGDKYYAELLLNTPQVGILDLGDTNKDTAQEWMKEAQDLFAGTDPMKIPVLYEHTSKVEWIPFAMKPNEMMYADITSRYINLVCAGYGMSPSDIGMGGGSNGGETLSGTIRDERKSKRTIQAVLKRKFKSLWDHILPESLEFTWIDFDDDQNVARGRARLANAQADEILTRNHIFAPQELRAQALQDGLVTVSVPETLDEKNIDWPQSGNTIRPGLIGEKVSAENGGRGETSSVQAAFVQSEPAWPQSEKESFKKKVHPVLLKTWMPIHDLITSTRGMRPEDINLWKQHVDDAIWWRDPEAGQMEEIEKKRRTITGALKHVGLGMIAFDKEDAPTVVSALREKAVLECSLRAEANNQEVTEMQMEAIENKVLAIDSQALLDKVSQEASDIARSIMASTIMSDMLEAQLHLDPMVEKSDNKARTVETVADKFTDTYPSLMLAAETAGQQILEKYLDTEAKNVQDS